MSTQTHSRLIPPPLAWLLAGIVGGVSGLVGMIQGLWLHDLLIIGLNTMSLSFAPFSIYRSLRMTGVLRVNTKGFRAFGREN